MYYTVATNNGDDIVRHYSFTNDGFLAAYAHARKFGYEVWQSFNDGPRYLLVTPRVLEDAA